MGPRVTSTLAVVAFVAAVGATAYVYTQGDPVRGADRTPGYSVATKDSTTTSAVTAPTGTHSRSSSPARASGSPRSARTRVVFLGDDYTAGLGASTSKHSWTFLVARSLSLRAGVVAENGAGYALKSPHGKNYLSLVDEVVAAKPDAVIVSGGRNDVHDNFSTLRQDALTLFRDLRHRLPDATLLALAPWWGDSPHPAALGQVAAAVRTAVRAAGGTYLDVADPLSGHPAWMKDAADPNDRGYAALAATENEAIGAALPR